MTNSRSDYTLTAADILASGHPSEEGAPAVEVYELSDRITCPYWDCEHDYPFPKSSARHACPECERPVAILYSGNVVRRPKRPPRVKLVLGTLFEGMPTPTVNIPYQSRELDSIKRTTSTPDGFRLFVDKVLWAVNAGIPHHQVVARALVAVETAKNRGTHETQRHTTERTIHHGPASQSTLPDDI